MGVRAKRPSAGELYMAPELAVLGVIEVALEVMLVAVDPAYSGADDDHAGPERRAGRALIRAAKDLAAAAGRYRRALEAARQRERDDLLPF